MRTADLIFVKGVEGAMILLALSLNSLKIIRSGEWMGLSGVKVGGAGGEEGGELGLVCKKKI